MNTACKSLLVAAASALLAACASTPRSDLAVAANAQSDSRYGVDHQYVEAVERASRNAGVRVVWVNPPRKADREN